MKSTGCILSRSGAALVAPSMVTILLVFSACALPTYEVAGGSGAGAGGAGGTTTGSTTISGTGAAGGAGGTMSAGGMGGTGTGGSGGCVSCPGNVWIFEGTKVNGCQSLTVSPPAAAVDTMEVAFGGFVNESLTIEPDKPIEPMTAPDGFVALVSLSGSVEKALTFGGGSVTGSQMVTSVVRLSNGQFVVGGNFSDSVTLGGETPTSVDPAGFVALYSAAGSLEGHYVVTASTSATVVAVAASPNGNIIVTGTFEGAITFPDGVKMSTGGTDVYVLGLSSDAKSAMWGTAFGGASAEQPEALAVDGSDKIVVVGSHQGEMSFSNSGTVVPYTGSKDGFVVHLTDMGSPGTSALRAAPTRAYS